MLVVVVDQLIPIHHQDQMVEQVVEVLAELALLVVMELLVLVEAAVVLNELMAVDLPEVDKVVLVL